MASSSSSWSYDVFLSFRGEDTRRGFVGHLHTALVQQGIHTYKDDETLNRGETIGPALFKAIQESKIVVIVFSENYADSSWCLDELAHIVKCMENKGQIVMPVFYDVDPSDVRRQNGKYGEAFTKHECENKHRVESWRKALLKAGNISGWDLKQFANGHEAKCIQDIVAKIYSMLSTLITNVDKDLIGIETRLRDLKSMLEIGSGGVRIVGIWGVGGGGKTTLASAAYMEISHQFEACFLVENIRDEVNKHGLKKLQEKFLSLVSKRDVHVGWGGVDGESKIKSMLCHKRVLVVLDDVDDLKQLEALAGSHDWFGDGSRIIITTRDEHLLTRHADKIRELSLLSHDEATKLFRKHAYRKDKPVEDYELLSQDVVSYANGLPLALEILGSFLYDKDKNEWISALAKLKRIPNVKVMERLKISYDGLEHDEKELFLDIACFLRRWEIDRAMRVLEACSFYPVIGVKVLEQKSLIKISNGRFDMHDLVEEMAHYIVRGEHPNHPEKHSRIWKEKDIVEFCAIGAETLMENNHIEVLALPSYSHPSLPRVGAIQSLDNRSYRLINSPLPNYVSHPRLPDVVANMKKLRWIYWEGYPASSFPTNFHPTKLGCLTLRRGQQKQLWQGCKDLPNLKILDLSYSILLTKTPDFNGLPCLERLILEDCIELKKIHPSIGYHERLVFVNMKGCLELKMFPLITRMSKLETLDLSWCSQLQKFPDIQRNMDSLVNLCLGRTAIKIIPPSVGQFCTNLVTFDLTGCMKLKRIEGNFRLLKSLKNLELFDCDKLEELGGDLLGNGCGIEVLSLSNSRQLGENHICLQSFHQDSPVSQKLPQFPRFLRKLDLSWCYLGDGDIPSDICEVTNLQVLNLMGNIFSRLHSSLSRIPCLKLLNLSSCKNLVELPDLPSSIAILIADHCDSLESIGDLSKYKWLWKVSLWGCKMLTGDGVRVLHSMLQANAFEDRFMSVQLPHGPSAKNEFSDTRRLMTLQLPHNWYSDFSGILIWSCDYGNWLGCSIVIKQEMLSMNSQPNHCKEFDKISESYEYAQVGYVPFGSLRHASWWNPTYTNVTFQIGGLANPKVGLVPMKSKSGDSRERPIDCSECWEDVDGHKKTFEIQDTYPSSIQILWSHNNYSFIFTEPWLSILTNF